MKKRIVGLAVLALLVFSVPVALPQMEQAQTVYTYVSEFQIPRTNWALFAEETEKYTTPVFQKLTADGTIIAWGNFEYIVHTPDGMTNGSWWQATSMAGITRVLDELRKGGPHPGQISATRHEDAFMRTLVRRSSPVSNGTGYIRVVGVMTQPGKADDYLALIKKTIIPIYDEMFKTGSMTYYGIDQQAIFTQPGSLRFGVSAYPTVADFDKVTAAINAKFASMTPSERSLWQGGLASTTVNDSRRDGLARITRYSQK